VRKKQNVLNARRILNKKTCVAMPMKIGLTKHQQNMILTHFGVGVRDVVLFHNVKVVAKGWYVQGVDGDIQMTDELLPGKPPTLEEIHCALGKCGRVHVTCENIQELHDIKKILDAWIEAKSHYNYQKWHYRRYVAPIKEASEKLAFLIKNLEG